MGEHGLKNFVTKTIFALVVRIERELISLHTKEVLHARKQTGVKFGRPHSKDKSKLDEHTDDIMKFFNLGVPKTLIAQQYLYSVGNLCNCLNKATSICII